MLIAFVLLGKNLEQRAKLKAASDMTGLLNILPSKARLMVDNDAEQSSFTEVPCGTLAVGDYILVLPGVSKYKSHRQIHILIEVLTHVFLWVIVLLLPALAFIEVWHVISLCINE